MVCKHSAQTLAFTTAARSGAASSSAGAGEALPKLTGSIADSFTDGEYSTVTFGHRSDVLESRGVERDRPGHFLGLENVDTTAEAEQAYNIARWENPANVVRTYRLTQDTPMFG